MTVLNADYGDVGQPGAGSVSAGFYLRRASLYRVSIAFLCVAVLGVVFPLVIVFNAENPDFDAGSVGAWCITFYAAARLGYVAIKGRIVPIDLTFWVFIVFWMGLAAFAQSLSDVFFWPGSYSPMLQLQGISIVIVALIAYECGRIFFRPLRFGRSKVELLITTNRVLMLSLLATALSVYAMWRLGGLSKVLVTRMEMDLHLWSLGLFSKSGALIIITLLRIPPLVALLSSWYLWVHRETLVPLSSHRVILVLLISWLALLNLVANFPLALARYWLGAIAISMLFIGTRKTSACMANWAVAFVFILLIAFPVSSQFRNMETVFDYQKLTMSGIVAPLYHGDYDAYQQILNTIGYVDKYGVSWGRNFVGAVLFWVPRSIWADKPFGTGQTVVEDIGYSYTNLSEPLWAEAYYGFGMAGVALLLLVYGYVTASLDHAYRVTDKPQSVIAIFVPFWMGFQIFFLRGDLMNGVAYSLPVIVLMLLAFLRVRVSRR